MISLNQSRYISLYLGFRRDFANTAGYKTKFLPQSEYKMFLKAQNKICKWISFFLLMNRLHKHRHLITWILISDKIYDQPYLDPENMSQRNPKVECCGTVGYNNQRQVCCSQYPGAEVVIPADDHLQCCVGSETGRLIGQLYFPPG